MSDDTAALGDEPKLTIAELVTLAIDVDITDWRKPLVTQTLAQRDRLVAHRRELGDLAERIAEAMRNVNLQLGSTDELLATLVGDARLKARPTTRRILLDKGYQPARHVAPGEDEAEDDGDPEGDDGAEHQPRRGGRKPRASATGSVNFPPIAELGAGDSHVEHEHALVG